ncbi:MAG TPA: 2-octaprenyl-6-methoxyphenyl hydroxylase [Gammaproteobacteria bacterium]
MTGNEIATDVLIVGGGLAGSTLAHALAATPLSTVLVEERNPAQLEQPSFDGRATALANGSQRILASLGLWEGVAGDAEAIRTIHVSERGRFGAARISAEEEGVQALGYTLENRILGAALWESLGSAGGFSSLAPAKLASLRIDDEAVIAVVESSGKDVTIRARVVVAADGANSTVRDVLGIGSREDLYDQKAVILNCATQLPHAGRAFERFTPSGPVAFLPLSRDRVSVVWTMSPDEAARAVALDEPEFRGELQSAFGHRLGRIERIGARVAYPLARVKSDALTSTRAVLIGSAAVNLHPVAGQGFNLALRDIATLAEIFTDALSDGGGHDPGSAELLGRYARWRERDQKTVAALTHGLIRLFGLGTFPVAASRGVGLMAFDLIPGAKAALARQTMGLSGRLPRLARGLPLVPAGSKRRRGTR